MSQLTIGLGQIHLSNADANVDVISYASVTFSTGDSQLFYVGAELLDLLQSHSLWACRGNGLRLRLQLFIDGHSLYQCKHLSAVLQKLGKLLESAELWRRLNLKANILPRENVLYSPSAGLALALQHQEPGKDCRRRLHGFGEGVAPHDVKPPPGVSTVYLTEVVISLDIVTEQSGILEAFAGDLGSAEFDHILYDSSSSSIACTTRCLHATLGLVPDAVDTALRLWISPKTVKSARGFRVVKDDRKSTLSDIFPSVWREGYMQTLSDRACLMPTISHALSRFANTNASSRRSSPQPCTMTSTDAEPPTAGNFGEVGNERGPHNSDNRALYSTIHSHLWKIAQLRLHERSPTPTSRPIITQQAFTIPDISHDHDTLIDPHVDSVPGSALSEENSEVDWLESSPWEEDEFAEDQLYHSDDDCLSNDCVSWDDFHHCHDYDLLNDVCLTPIEEEVFPIKNTRAENSVHHFHNTADDYDMHDILDDIERHHENPVWFPETFTDEPAMGSGLETFAEAIPMLGHVEIYPSHRADRMAYERGLYDSNTISDEDLNHGSMYGDGDEFNEILTMDNDG